MSFINRSDISEEISAVYLKKFLYTAEPRIVYLRYAQKQAESSSIPTHGGSFTAKWRRYENLSVNTTTLTEGVTPEGSDQSITDVTATVSLYGNYIRFSDVIDTNSIDPYVTKTSERLAYNMQQTLDTIARNVLLAGTNVIYGGTATSRVTVATTDLITTTMIAKAVRTLESADAMYYNDQMLRGSQDIQSNPIAEGYVGIVHPLTTYTLRTLTGFIPVHQYARPEQALPGEIGAYNQVRFIQTTQAAVFAASGASSQDVYGTLIFGTDAFGAVDINELTATLIVKPLGDGGTSDPLNQRGTLGWKAAFVTKILNDNFMIRLEHSVAA